MIGCIQSALKVVGKLKERSSERSPQKSFMALNDGRGFILIVGVQPLCPGNLRGALKSNWSDPLALMLLITAHPIRRIGGKEES
jgi:hypothetical protein